MRLKRSSEDTGKGIGHGGGKDRDLAPGITAEMAEDRRGRS